MIIVCRLLAINRDNQHQGHGQGYKNGYWDSPEHHLLFLWAGNNNLKMGIRFFKRIVAENRRGR